MVLAEEFCLLLRVELADNPLNLLLLALEVVDLRVRLVDLLLLLVLLGGQLLVLLLELGLRRGDAADSIGLVLLDFRVGGEVGDDLVEARRGHDHVEERICLVALVVALDDVLEVRLVLLELVFLRLDFRLGLLDVSLRRLELRGEIVKLRRCGLVFRVEILELSLSLRLRDGRGGSRGGEREGGAESRGQGESHADSCSYVVASLHIFGIPHIIHDIRAEARGTQPLQFWPL